MSGRGRTMGVEHQALEGTQLQKEEVPQQAHLGHLAARAPATALIRWALDHELPDDLKRLLALRPKRLPLL